MVVVGMLNQIMTLTGARGLLSLAVVTLPVAVLFATLWIILPVIAALALLTPLLCLYWITKGTIQERLGAVE